MSVLGLFQHGYTVCANQIGCFNMGIPCASIKLGVSTGVYSVRQSNWVFQHGYIVCTNQIGCFIMLYHVRQSKLDVSTGVYSVRQ